MYVLCTYIYFNDDAYIYIYASTVFVFAFAVYSPTHTKRFKNIESKTEIASNENMHMHATKVLLIFFVVVALPKIAVLFTLNLMLSKYT